VRLGPGLSFSWRRALGVAAFKGRLSRRIGIPLTRSGRERKVGPHPDPRAPAGAGDALTLPRSPQGLDCQLIGPPRHP
jgi:hypothetical protein